MGIFDALTTAVTGLQAQSFALQNISGNIANSQTTAFKRTDTQFEDFVTGTNPAQQVSGNVDASSRATNSVQGSIQTSTIGTFMAVNGDGFFVVEKPSSFTDGRPVFGGVNLYTRRGDFQPDKNGFLVNGSGYYLMGIPIDATTGNPSGSAPQILQFSNDFLPAQATTQIQYRANLASSPLTTNSKPSLPGSELLNPADFEANPIAYSQPQPAKIIGTGAALAPDAVAVATGTQDISALPTGGVAGSIVINGTTVGVAATDTAADIATNISAAVANVTASINASNELVLTSANASTDVTIGGGSTVALLNKLGLTVGNTPATNLLNQNAVAPNQTLIFQVTGSVPANPALTVTFGTGGGQVQTLAQLSTKLATLAGGAATVNTLNGNINVTAASTANQITVGGTATAKVFGIHSPLFLPANGTVAANDLTTFLNESLSGGSITGYDVSGAPVDVQVRWAKVASVASSGTDTWNMFYQINSTATGTQPAWQNVGTTFTFAPNGQMSPAITNLTLPGVTVNGVSLGNVQLNFGSGGITQFADPNGNVNVNLLSQNGSPAGNLQTIAINNQGRVDGTFSNGRTVDLAEIPLANFTGQNFLQKLDGGAFAETAESGSPLFNSNGKIVGSSLEASNTDIADEFSKLIVTQQAYSANTKIITTGKEMVQTMLNMIQ
jgi:flagellar hook protein FlgE